MAIRVADQQAAQRGGPTFKDVPARLRPSGFGSWLDEVPAVPDHSNEDHVASAYGLNLEEVAEVAAQHAPRAIPADGHWRSQVAEAAQWESYYSWCEAHGLVEDGVDPRSKGAVAPAWRWSELRRWEAGR